MADVTQADREAAARLLDIVSEFRHPSGAAQHILDGKGDGSPFVTFLARHRTEAVKPLVEAEGLDRVIALAICNEMRRFSGFKPFDSLDQMAEHHYRDQLRYARAVIAALRSVQS